MSMENKYEEVVTSIKRAEEALEILKNFSENQYKEKGDTMLEQILNYIVNTLSNANYMCCSFKYKHLALTKAKNIFIFYIYDNSAIGSGYPAFSITTDGEVNYTIHLSEWMMLTLVKEWDEFKKELDSSIKTAIKERTKSINNQLCHIGYINEQLSKWHV